jgi:hypothetical protein
MSILRDLGLVFIALLMVSAIVNGQTSSQSSEPERPSDATNGNLTGTVIGDRGQPLIGAVVLLRRLGVVGNNGRQVTTNNEGRFQAGNLETGLYSITANAPAYVMLPREPDTPAPLYRVGDNVRLDLIRGGVITGTITNALNEPVIGVRARALMVRDANGQPMKGLLTTWGQAASDDRGIYRMFGLPPGTYIIEVGGYANPFTASVTPYDLDAPTYAPSSTRDTAAEITVTSAQENTVDVRYRAEPGHVVSGRVSNSGTNGASILLMPLMGVPDGVYDLIAQQNVNLPGGSFELSMSEPKRITVKGADITGIELTTKPSASISGTIVFQPSSVAECKGKRRPLLPEIMVVMQRNRKNSDSESLVFQRASTSTAFPEKDGTLVWRNLSGQYAFLPRFFARYWYLQSITLTSVGAASAKTAMSNQKIDAARNWTTLKSGDRLSGLTITLSEGAASIRGRLTVAEGQNPPPNLNVFVVPAEREKADDILRYFAIDVASDQAFSADNLPPGKYWIIAQPRLSSDAPGSNLRLPDANENRTKIRAAAELSKNEIELKPCQNVTDYKLTIKP